MNSNDKESIELEKRMRLALQKSGELIPTDLEIDGEPCEEAMAVPIPESLSNIDAAMKRIFAEDEEEELGNSNLLEFPRDKSSPFALAARNGEVKLSDKSMKKLNRDEN